MKDVVSTIKAAHMIYVLVCFSVLALMLAEGESRTLLQALQVLEKIEDLSNNQYSIKQARTFRDICIEDFRENTRDDSSQLWRINGVVLPAYCYVLNRLHPHFTIDQLADYFTKDYYYYNFIPRDTLYSLAIKELTGPLSPYGPNAASELRRIWFKDDFRNPGGLEEIEVNDTASWVGIAIRSGHERDTVTFKVYIDLAGRTRMLLDIHAPPGSYNPTRDIEFKHALDSSFNMNFDVTDPRKVRGARLSQLMLYDKEIGSLELEDAIPYLKSKLDESRSRLGPVDLNLSLRWAMVFTPAILLILSLYMLVSLLQIRRIVTTEDDSENLWFPFYKLRLAWALALISLVALPLTTQAIVLFQFIYYGFDVNPLLLALVVSGVIAQTGVAVRIASVVRSIRSIGDSSDDNCPPSPSPHNDVGSKLT